MIKTISYNYIKRDKKTIVLLHGWGMDKSSFDELVHFFSKKYSVLTLDFLGFGDSDNAEEYYDTYEYAYQTFLLLSELAVNEIVIVGHSFGGRIAIILSSMFGLKISGLVLTSSAGLNRFDLIKKIKIISYKILKKLCDKGLIKKEKIDTCGSADYKKLSNVMRGVFVRIVNQDLTYLLNNICVKTILVWDKKDNITPYWICKKLHKNIKCSQTFLFSNGKHFTCFCNVFKFINICEDICVNVTNCKYNA